MSGTLNYYEENAEKFIADTVHADVGGLLERFAAFLPEGGSVLDFGCGSGRDTKWFLEHGYRAEASDGSKELCLAASAYTGIEVKQLLFEELDETERYDGIWACASVLHAGREALPEIFRRISKALKNGGALYVSFKYGEFAGERNGRYFTDLTEEVFEELIKKIPGLSIKEIWKTGDVRAGRNEQLWLNAICVKAL